MRKNYIDNLRTMCILLLFPFHTFMIYNNWGETFYVHGKEIACLSWFNIIVYPWWMTLLFTLAGISSAYALKKRTPKIYVKERIHKILLPLIFGLILVIPVQSYVADCFWNQYRGNYISHYRVFFTKFTDITGYDGGFTVGQTWFMLYLFIISIVMLPVMNWYSKREKKVDGNKITMPRLLPLFLVILLLTPIIELGGKSLTESLACFVIGYFLLSMDEVEEKLSKNVVWLGIIFVIAVAFRVALFGQMDHLRLLLDIEQRMITWFGILFFLGFGKRYWNGSNRITKYLAKSSFSLYFFHQSYIVILGYVAIKYIPSVIGQISVILIGSLALSLITYEIAKRFKITCFLFGIKQ